MGGAKIAKWKKFSLPRAGRGGGQTWKKWTKYILVEKNFLKKVILTKILDAELGGAEAPLWHPPRYGPGLPCPARPLLAQFIVHLATLQTDDATTLYTCMARHL